MARKPPVWTIPAQSDELRLSGGNPNWKARGSPRAWHLAQPSPPGPMERPVRTRHVERWPCTIFAARAETARRSTGRNGPPAGALWQTQTAATSSSTAQKLDPEQGEYRSALRVKPSWLTTGSAMGPRAGGGLGACIVLAVLAIMALVVLCGVCVFAIVRMRPSWLRFQVGAGLFKFSVEMGRPPDREGHEQRCGLRYARRQPGSGHGAVLAPREDERPHRSGSAVSSSVCHRKAQ